MVFSMYTCHSKGVAASKGDSFTYSANTFDFS